MKHLLCEVCLTKCQIEMVPQSKSSRICQTFWQTRKQQQQIQIQIQLQDTRYSTAGLLHCTIVPEELLKVPTRLRERYCEARSKKQRGKLHAINFELNRNLQRQRSEKNANLC